MLRAKISLYLARIVLLIIIKQLKPNFIGYNKMWRFPCFI